MRKIKEVLRLNASGMSNRKIARSCGISRPTVGEYLQRASRAGVAWPLPEELNDTATTEIYTLSLHDALPIYRFRPVHNACPGACVDNRRHAAYHHNKHNPATEPRWLFPDQFEIKTDKTWNLQERRGTLILSLVIRCRIKQTAPSGNDQVI
jgi:hypothetical protein